MKKKFTFIDVIIILVLVIALVGGFLYLSKDNIKSKLKTEKINFTILISSVEKGSLDELAKGDKFNISFKNEESAVITEIKREPANVMTFDSLSGEYKTELSEINEDIYINAVAEVNIDEINIKAGDIVLKVGLDISVITKSYSLNGIIYSIDTAD